MLEHRIMDREETPIFKHLCGTILISFVLTTAGCSGPFEGRELAALPVNGTPTIEDWERAVPLVVQAWMGNVNQRPEIVALDRETIHRSTAQCHHGPSVSEPVEVRLQALYTDEEIFILARWRDRTRDTDLGRWVRAGDQWAAAPGEDDGIAILWGPEGRSDFRCQNTCHMVDVDVYDGAREMRMEMKLDGPGSADLWRWRSGLTGAFDLADDMIVDREGKRGDEGQTLARESRPPADPAGLPDPEGPVPYLLIEKPRGGQADVRARWSWDRGWWKVMFRRRLTTGDSDDREFAAGDRIGFSLGVFDNTFSEHHVVEKGLELRLEVPDRYSALEEEEAYEPLDF